MIVTLIAPTEGPAMKTLGKVSMLPERFGVDAMFWSRGARHGVQRKEVKDLMTSVADGRLAKELAQMRALTGEKLLIVEGKPRWTNDGRMMVTFGRDWSRRAWEGLMWSVQDAGCWVAMTDDVAGTVEMIQWFREWCAKDHRALKTRPGPGTNMWGRKGDRDFAVWMLQAIPGWGPELSGRVWDEFGRLPLKLDVEVEELMKVKGMGAKKVEGLLKVLGDGHAI